MNLLKSMISLLVAYLLVIPSLPAEEAGGAASVIAPEDPAAPNELMIHDFELGMENNLGGASGAWNLDPADINNAWAYEDAVTMIGKDGKESQVLKLEYSLESEVKAQNGFWTKLNDLDASHYDHLQFDVKGDAEAGFTEKFKIEIKKLKPGTTDEKIKGSRELTMTDQWTTVSIALNTMTGVIDFADPKAWEDPSIARKNLDEFVIVLQDRHVTKKTGIFYIDNIKLVRTGNPGPTAVDFPPRHKLKPEEKELDKLGFQKYLVSRLLHFPTQVVVKKQFPENDDELLMEVAKDTWKFFDSIVDKDTGLPLDTVQLGKETAMDEGTWIGDYTNVTNIGVYLMAVVGGYDMGFITKEDAVARLQKTLTTVEGLEYHESGFPFNYYDTTTAERTSFFISLVDSGWLVSGLYVAKNAFPELAEQAQRLIERGNFSFFYDPVEQQMFHGYYQHLKVYSDYHYGVFYTEPRAASYLAIAQGQAPEEHWFGGMFRTFPENYDWQSQPPKERIMGTQGGYTYEGGYYEWKGMRFIPNWGGSAFESLMPTLILKEKELSPEGLGLNNAIHVQGQIKYALEDLGYPVWGMSPSSKPEGGYTEYGAKPLGNKGYKAGAVTPHASALGVEYAPKEVAANFRKLVELYDVYGEYGFYDAVTVETGLVARKYLSLDQGMIFVALVNYFKNGSIRKYFHADPAMKSAEHLLTEEKFFGQIGFPEKFQKTEEPETAAPAQTTQPAAVS